MANPTITKSNGSFQTSGTSELTFYDAQTESFRKNAGLINIPLPATDSSGAVIFDLLGTTREITVRGKFVPTGGNVTIGKFTRDINSLIQGSQGDLSYSFSAVSISGAISVYVQDANWDYSTGEGPNIVDYSVSLIEAGSGSG